MQRAPSARRLLITGIAAACVLAARSAAQDAATARDSLSLPAYRARVLGVFDATTGAPVADADVIDVLSGASARTTSTGTVALVFLPDGGGLVRTRKLGYEEQTMIVAISPADTVPVTVVLQPVVKLPEVVTTGTPRFISPSLRSFEERRLHSTTGYFVSDSVLRKEDGRMLGTVLLSHVPGIQIVHKGRYTLLMQSPRCSMLGPEAAGPPDVYLDGVPLPHPPPPPSHGFSTTAGLQPFDLGEFDVSNLAGVEYYPDGAALPPEFSRTSKGCGALLLWTREK